MSLEQRRSWEPHKYFTGGQRQQHDPQYHNAALGKEAFLDLLLAALESRGCRDPWGTPPHRTPQPAE